MPADVQKLKKRFDDLKSARGTLNSHCEDVATYFTPRHMGFIGDRTAYDKRMHSIYDSTGCYALELAAAGLHGMATNPASRWFGLRIQDVGFEDDDGSKKYLGDVEQAMRAYMYAPGTNLTTALHECYLELLAFGTALMFIGESTSGNLLFQSRPLAECYIAENADGRVDAVYRRSMMTARQIVKMWPDKCSPEIQQKAVQASSEKFEICHAVEPRKDYDNSARDRKNMAFASCYFETKTDKLLEESGFKEFPYAVARWTKFPGEEYGRSVAMMALPDAKMLQEMMKVTLQAAHMMARPPINVPDDGVTGPVRAVPGGFTYYRGDRMPTPWKIDGNIPVTMELMDGVRTRIMTTMFADLMQMSPDNKMTATEYMQRVSERMRILGPSIGRIEGEMLSQIINRVFGMMTTADLLPEAPEHIAGADLTIEFVSPIAMAQKQTEANALGQTLAYLEPLAALDPTIFDRLRKDKLASWLWTLHGGDQDMLIGDEEWAALQEQQQMQQAMMTAVAAAPPLADAAQKGAGAVDKLASAQEKGADVAGAADMFNQRQAA